ncbi:MAG: DUF454 family protein [Oscillospiraceae bacterium]
MKLSLHGVRLIQFYHNYLLKKNHNYIKVKYMNLLYKTLSILSFSIGVLGAFIPILPTTPFILLALHLASKTDSKILVKIKSSKVYIKYVKEFDESKTLSKSRKIFLLTSVSIILLFPLIILKWYLKIIIILTYILLYWYFIFKIKTK